MSFNGEHRNAHRRCGNSVGETRSTVLNECSCRENRIVRKPVGFSGITESPRADALIDHRLIRTTRGDPGRGKNSAIKVETSLRTLRVDRAAATFEHGT